MKNRRVMSAGRNDGQPKGANVVYPCRFEEEAIICWKESWEIEAKGDK